MAERDSRTPPLGEVFSFLFILFNEIDISSSYGHLPLLTVHVDLRGRSPHQDSHVTCVSVTPEGLLPQLWLPNSESEMQSCGRGRHALAFGRKLNLTLHREQRCLLFRGRLRKSPNPAWSFQNVEGKAKVCQSQRRRAPIWKTVWGWGVRRLRC